MPSLHNTLLFKPCLNLNDDRITIHGANTPIPAVVDNDYNTFSSENDLGVNIANAAGGATRVHAIAYKGTGVDSYVATPVGGVGGAVSRTIPDTVANWNQDAIPTLVDGLQHDLFLLPSDGFTAASVRMQFSGSDIKIYELMLLELGLEFNSNDAPYDVESFRSHQRDRSGDFHTNIQGFATRLESVNQTREKWEFEYTLKFIPGRTTVGYVDTFLSWKSKYKNFVFAQEPSRYPQRIFPATFPDLQTQVVMRSNSKISGDRVTVRIWEQ